MPSEQASAPQARFRHLRSVLMDQDAYATTLTVILIDVLGTDYFTWAPETIRREVLDEFQAELPSKNLHKIMAVIALITTDDFYNNLPRFIQLCNVLADDEFDPFVFDPADSAEMAWAITEAMLLDPPEDPEHAFADEIRYYIGEVTSEEGIVNPPDVLGIAKRDTHSPDPIGAFADDPVMYNAFWDAQRDKGDWLNEMLRERLQELMSQVTSLPLAEGNTDELLKRMRREMMDAQES